MRAHRGRSSAGDGDEAAACSCDRAFEVENDADVEVKGRSTEELEAGEALHLRRVWLASRLAEFETLRDIVVTADHELGGRGSRCCRCSSKSAGSSLRPGNFWGTLADTARLECVVTWCRTATLGGTYT